MMSRGAPVPLSEDSSRSWGRRGEGVPFTAERVELDRAAAASCAGWITPASSFPSEVLVAMVVSVVYGPAVRRRACAYAVPANGVPSGCDVTCHSLQSSWVAQNSKAQSRMARWQRAYRARTLRLGFVPLTAPACAQETNRGPAATRPTPGTAGRPVRGVRHRRTRGASRAVGDR